MPLDLLRGTGVVDGIENQGTLSVVQMRILQTHIKLLVAPRKLVNCGG